MKHRDRHRKADDMNEPERKRRHASGPTRSSLTTAVCVRVPNGLHAAIAAEATPGERVRGGGTAGAVVRRLALCEEAGAERLRELSRRAAGRSHPDGSPWTAGELLDELLALDAAPPLPAGGRLYLFADDEATVPAALEALRPRGIVALGDPGRTRSGKLCQELTVSVR